LVSKDPDCTKGYIKLILEEFEGKGLTDQLAQHGSRIDDLVMKMNED